MVPAVFQPERPPMQPTTCPKLQRMRELVAEEDAAKVPNDRAQHRATAIDQWHATPGPRVGTKRSSSLGSICEQPEWRSPRSS